MNIAKIMVPKALTVCMNATDSVRQGTEIMRRHGYTAIPVLDSEGRFLGCVNDRDFLRFIVTEENYSPERQEQVTVGQIMRRDFCPPVPITASSGELIDAVLQQNFVPIVDDRGCLCGIVTRRLVIAELAGRDLPAGGEFSE